MEISCVGFVDVGSVFGNASCCVTERKRRKDSPWSCDKVVYEKYDFMSLHVHSVYTRQVIGQMLNK